MMNDIVKRLKKNCLWHLTPDNDYPYGKHLQDCDICQAADTIEQLQARVKELEELIIKHKEDAHNWYCVYQEWFKKYQELESVQQCDGLKALKEMIAVQCTDGTWNYDPYMLGMANGMIFAQSLFDDKQPEYLDPPKVWLKDLPDQEIKSQEVPSQQEQSDDNRSV